MKKHLRFFAILFFAFFVAAIFAMLVASIFSVGAYGDGQFVPSAGVYAETGQPVNMRAYQTSGSSECYFPWVLIVKGIEERDDGRYNIVGVTYPVTDDSHVYVFASEDGDWMIDDLVAVIMSNNLTADVLDDTILAARYIGSFSDVVW